MSMSESMTEFSIALPPYFPPRTSSSVRVGGLVLVVGSCGVLIVIPKLLLHLFCLPTFSYVVNECCMKSPRPVFCWKWTYRSVLRATTTDIKAQVLVYGLRGK